MENEIPPINRVDTIREELTALQGERLKVRANMGRSRIVERTGTLLMAHPSLFVIEVEERRSMANLLVWGEGDREAWMGKRGVCLKAREQLENGGNSRLVISSQK